MANNISVRSVTFTPSLSGVLIVVQTDVACTLFCRLTSEKPRIHTRSVQRRGVPFVSELRFCFVSYEDNQQQEVGDTFTHTWWKPNWAYCVTKYCYFWGYINSVLSPSTSAFFKFHNPFTGVYWFLRFEEPWSAGPVPPPPEYQLLFLEQWSTVYPSDFMIMFWEDWSS